MPRDPARSGLTRRASLQLAVGAALLPAFTPRPAQAQPARTPLAIAQVVDLSPGQQDVSRDFTAGSRAAWLDFNARGGLAGRSVAHTVLETDGTPAALRAAVGSAASDPGCLALSGTVGHSAALQVAALAAQSGIGHAAPWLQEAPGADDRHTLPVFADATQQIAHALGLLNTMGIPQLTAVYAGTGELARHRAAVQRAAQAAGVQAEHLAPGAGGLQAMGRQLDASPATVLLFLGGTPELLQLVPELRGSRQRYLIALADVNPQTLLDLRVRTGATSVIVAQAVPMVTAGLPVVRDYRAALARYFDEAPTALGLAGFIAARSTQALLRTVEGTPARAAVLAALQKRPLLDVGGHLVGAGRAPYVTQTMLGRDGRMLG